MTLPLYMDHHVRMAITRGLRSRGIDVLTAEQDDHEEAADDALLQRATDMGRVLFSQDQDLLEIAAGRQQESIPFAGLVYAHQRHVTIGQCIEELELICKVYEAQELNNRVLFVPLS